MSETKVWGIGVFDKPYREIRLITKCETCPFCSEDSGVWCSYYKRDIGEYGPSRNNTKPPWCKVVKVIIEEE